MIPVMRPIAGRSRKPPTRGLVASHLANTMRCWFPPRKRLRRGSNVRRENTQSTNPFLRQGTSAPRRHQTSLIDQAVEYGDGHVVSYRLSQVEFQAETVFRP